MDQDSNVTPITSARRPFRPDPAIPPYDPSNPSHRSMFEMAWRFVEAEIRRRERDES
jgi:hypothetical protein